MTFKRLLGIPGVLLLVALSLSACAGLPGPSGGIGGVIRAVTTPIANPVDSVDIYRLKNTYAAALTLAVKYREYCWSKPYGQLMRDAAAKAVCQHRRQVVRTIQKYRPPAGMAVQRAETFVLQNPTLSATSVIASAWDAVTAFRQAIPLQQ